MISGFAGTVVLTFLLAASQGLGLTRMNVAYMLGTMFTPDRDLAKLIGVLVHMFDGWVLSLVYVAAMHVVGYYTWWFGAIIGLVHGLFVITVVLPAIPAIHPRMASSQHGPSVVQQLEPPGFLGRNYGLGTPVSAIISHIVFGAIVGLLYRP
jgi:uncharacterized membrane protein YagU involved in acid resistance